MSHSTIALLIPCFNGLQYLPRLMESVHRLDKKFDEIIVYDDASTEPLPFDPVVKFPEIRFYRGFPNGGAGYARNRLMELASTDYIHFHDIDDTEIPKTFLTELIPHLSPDTVVFSSWQINWTDGKPPKLYDYEEFSYVKDFREFFLRGHIHMNAAIFPRQLALKVGFDEDFKTSVEDLVFNVRLANAGAQYKHISQVIAKHEKNNESTLSQMKFKEFLNYRVLYCQRCREILPDRYHETIGKIALYYAWDACLKGFSNEFKLFIKVAKECGSSNFDQFGKWVELFAPWLGIENTLRIRRWWYNHHEKKQV